MKVKASVLLGAARHMNSLLDNAAVGSLHPPQIPSMAAGSAWEHEQIAGWERRMRALDHDDLRAIIQQCAHLAMLASVAAADGFEEAPNT